MGVYNNNKDGTRSTLANTIQVVDAPIEQFVSRGEFSAVTPNDVSADNKLVAENEVTKVYDTMPTASVDLVDKIVQYVGTTTANYTNGYFYKCVSDGAVTPTYSWVEVIGGGSSPLVNIIDSPTVGNTGGVVENATREIENYDLGDDIVVTIIPNVASGDFSHAEGISIKTPDNETYVTTASGSASHAEGHSTTASGNVSHAEGDSTTASGDSSHAEGGSTTASGICSHAEGSNTFAQKEGSHAEGYWTYAHEDYAHAEGNGTHASGLASHAEGSRTSASGDDSHAEGYYTYASGDCSHAEGSDTTASYDYQHVQGKFNDNKEDTFFEIGNGEEGNEYNIFEIYSDGSLSQNNGTDKYKFAKNNNVDGFYDGTGTFHAFGEDRMTINGSNAASEVTFSGAFTVGTRASGSTVGTNSTAEGQSTTASASCSHAEGGGTTASGNSAHAEGANTTAGGNFAHAEGSGTTSSNTASHAEGYNTTASGSYAHAEGRNNTAGYTCQHVCGKYNSNKSATLMEVGNGTATNARSNAFEVYSDGSLSTDNGTTKTKLPVIKSKTLVANATSVIFDNMPSSGNNLIQFYTDKAGLDYTAITTSGTNTTLTYPAQSSDTTVYCSIVEVM